MFQDKKTIRKKFKQLRMRLSREEALKKSSEIKKRLFQLEEFVQAKTIAFYVAKKEACEVETEEMIKESLALGKRVVVPLVNKEKKEILFSELKNYDSELAPGAFGILEPKPSCRRIVPLEEIDLVIVPALAFDTKGYRLGYGGGYYDRLIRKLAQVKPSVSFVGLAYEIQVVNRLPRSLFDVPVDVLVTEKRVLHF